MDIELKKKLVRNWFKILQNAICDDINKLENNKTKFKLKKIMVDKENNIFKSKFLQYVLNLYSI